MPLRPEMTFQSVYIKWVGLSLGSSRPQSKQASKQVKNSSDRFEEGKKQELQSGCL